MKILVVDDDPLSRRLAEAAVTRLGHDATTAEDGAAAWQCITLDRLKCLSPTWSGGGSGAWPTLPSDNRPRTIAALSASVAGRAPLAAAVQA